MITQSDLDKYDARGMYKIYDEWPNIAKKSYESESEYDRVTEIDHVIFAGMGGSGALGDVFSSILSKINIHVSVVKGYLLPKTTDEKTLVVATSISGNTIETLTVLNSALKMNCKIIAFSSGGKMENFCKKNNVEYRKPVFHHSPRASFTGYLYSMLKALSDVLPIEENEVNESIDFLKKTHAKVSTQNLTETNESLNLARWINGIPLIYYPGGLQAAAIRFKNSLQENAKMHAAIEDVVEACHNGIVAWEQRSNVKPILIEGTEDHIKTKERWEIIKKYFKENKIEYREIHSISGNILSKLICLIYLLDYSTIYLAVQSKIDPSPVNSIDYIKKKLN